MVRGLRAVAVFEATKGALVLLAGFGIFALLHSDVQHAVEQCVRSFHLNPANHYPRIFLQLAGEATPPRLQMLAAAAFAYALVRFIEAYGLWRERVWAEWFAVASGGIYLPIELWELTRGITWPRVLILSVNLVIVVYLGRELSRRRGRKQQDRLPKTTD